MFNLIKKFTVIFLLLNLFLSISGNAVELPKVIVFDFYSEIKTRCDPIVVTDIFKEELLATKHFNVMSKEEAEKLLKPQIKFFPECTDKECAIKYGKLLKTQKAILGSVEPKGANVKISIEYIDVNSSETEFSTSIDYSGRGSDTPALRTEIQKLVSMLVQNTPLKGKVIKVVDKQIYINFGSKESVVPGNRFTVKSQKEDNKDIAEIEIVKVIEDEISECKVVKGTNPQVNDIVIPIIVQVKGKDEKEPADVGKLWKRTVVSSGESFIRPLSIGSGRNDGVIRLYGECRDEHIYEFTWSDDMWDRASIGSCWVEFVAVGDGRGDGIKRVYVACMNGHIYEFAYSNGIWNKVDVGSASSFNDMHYICIGDGRNDGTTRVYSASQDGNIYEFTFSKGMWNKNIVDTSSYYIWSMSIGDLHNDGTVRLYSAMDNHIYEFTYSNGVWNKVNIASDMSGNIYSIHIGNGRGDRITRLYASCNDGHIYEFTYSNGIWNKTDVGFGSKSKMNYVYIGAGRNDGITRVYSACEDGHIYEFTYSNNKWNKIDIGMGGSFLSSQNSIRSVLVGAARNDNIIRVYAVCNDGNIYEFTYSP